jgi:hypothetical protein
MAYDIFYFKKFNWSIQQFLQITHLSGIYLDLFPEHSQKETAPREIQVVI